MKPEELRDLHYIAHLVNLDSILSLGILSHNQAARIDHMSVADEAVQARRHSRRIPNGLDLHDYANLYLDARNAMMYRVSMGMQHRQLCVIEVAKDVLDLPGVVLTNGNAASGAALSAAQVFTPEQGVRTLRTEDVYCEWWTDPDPYRKQEKLRKRMAEVLVPHRVPPAYFRRVLVSCVETESMLLRRGCAIMVARSEHLFFR